MAFDFSLQIKGWQVRKRPIGMRPRIEAVPSVATALKGRWSTGYPPRFNASSHIGDVLPLLSRRPLVIPRRAQYDNGGTI